MKSNKIGWRDWEILRKWHLYSFGLTMGLIGAAIGHGFNGNWEMVLKNILLVIAVQIISISKMIKDKELAERNNGRRIWLQW